jgi:hypothetical protein
VLRDLESPISKLVQVGLLYFIIGMVLQTQKSAEKVIGGDVSVGPFQVKYRKIVEEEDMSVSHIYSEDGMGLFWMAVPENTQANKKYNSVPGRKLSKECLTALVCANADGSHGLIPVIIGMSAKPRLLRHIIKTCQSVTCPVRKYGQHKNCLLTSFITISYLRLRNTRCMNLNMSLKT